jgi:hypothetical protein
MNSASPTIIYAACLYAIFLLLPLLSHGIPFLYPEFIHAKTLLDYHYIIGRHSMIGPWTFSGTTYHVLYLAVNTFTLCYRADSPTKVASRATTLALINLAPVYLGLRLSFLSDVFCVSVRQFKRLHRSFGLVAVGHLIIHSTIMTVQHGLTEFQNPRILFAVVV